MSPKRRAAQSLRERAGIRLWGPCRLPGANFIGRIWEPVEGGAEVEISSRETSNAWVPFDHYPDYASLQCHRTEVWEIRVSQVEEIEPLVRAITRRWALAQDEDFSAEPDFLGFRARYLTLVSSSGSIVRARLVTDAMSKAREYALRVYKRWMNTPRIAVGELEALKADLLDVHSNFDSAAPVASLPTDISVDALTRAASHLADLWGWQRDEGAVAVNCDDLPVGTRVGEGPSDPTLIGIGELLFLGTPVSDRAEPADDQNPQLMFQLPASLRYEPIDAEWERLFEGLTVGSVRAVIEDVSLRSLLFHVRGYEPTDRKTDAAVHRNVRLLVSGERPWLRVRQAIPAGGYVVSQDYALLKAYKEVGLRFARCLVLVKDRPQ